MSVRPVRAANRHANIPPGWTLFQKLDTAAPGALDEAAGQVDEAGNSGATAHGQVDAARGTPDEARGEVVTAAGEADEEGNLDTAALRQDTTAASSTSPAPATRFPALVSATPTAAWPNLGAETRSRHAPSGRGGGTWCNAAAGGRSPPVGPASIPSHQRQTPCSTANGALLACPHETANHAHAESAVR